MLRDRKDAAIRGDAGIWRGAADTCSQTGTDLNLLLSASVCCSADKHENQKTTFCCFPNRNFPAHLSYNMIKELEVVLSRVWFQAAVRSDRGARVRKQKTKFVNCTWLKENKKKGVIFPDSSLPWSGMERWGRDKGSFWANFQFIWKLRSKSGLLPSLRWGYCWFGILCSVFAGVTVSEQHFWQDFGRFDLFRVIWCWLWLQQLPATRSDCRMQLDEGHWGETATPK